MSDENNREITVRIYEEGEMVEEQIHYVTPDTDLSRKTRQISKVFKNSVLVEGLSILAHRLWTHWSQHIAKEENISRDRLNRWQNLWVPFDELSEEMQDKDRELVDRFLHEQPDYTKTSTDKEGDSEST